MSEIPKGVATEASAYFCPKCQMPVTMLGSSVTLEKRVFACGTCGWGGTEDQLVRYDFKHEFASDAEIADRMARDLHSLLARSAAQTYGAFLLKWGFLDQPITTKQLAMYLEAISKAILPAIVDTRRKMIEEKVHAAGS